MNDGKIPQGSALTLSRPTAPQKKREEPEQNKEPAAQSLADPNESKPPGPVQTGRRRPKHVYTPSTKNLRPRYKTTGVNLNPEHEEFLKVFNRELEDRGDTRGKSRIVRAALDAFMALSMDEKRAATAKANFFVEGEGDS